MKRLLFLLAFVVVALGAFAQTSVTTSRVHIVGGATKDTVNKNGAYIQSFFVANYAPNAKFQVHQTKIKGTYAKTKTYLEYSYDNTNWVKLDSVSVAGNTYGTSALKSPYSQYIRLRTVGVDSTQTTRIKYFFFIEKQP